MKRIPTIIIMGMMAFCAYGQNRTSVIIDNDFAGDPDGLYALAHLMSSTSVDVKAIVCSHLHEGENWSELGVPAPVSGMKEVKKLQDAMQADWSTITLPEDLTWPLWTDFELLISVMTLRIFLPMERKRDFTQPYWTI